jgi:hypothetical protein
MRLSALLAALVDGRAAIAHHLAGLYLDGEPPLAGDLRSALHRAAAREAADDLVVEREAGEALAILAPIVPLPWKGRTLAAAHWPRPAMRPAGDLDLLLEPSAVDEAARRLERAGYRRAPADPSGRFRAPPTGIELIPPSGKRMGIDLHARPFRSVGARIALDSLLARAHFSTVAGQRVRLLDPADELHLCFVHAAKHAVASLKWLLDLCAIAAHADGETWQKATSRALESGTGRALFAAAQLAATVGAAVPEAVFAELAPPAPWRALLSRLFSIERARAGHPLDARTRYALELSLEESLAARARAVVGVAERLAARLW